MTAKVEVMNNSIANEIPPSPTEAAVAQSKRAKRPRRAPRQAHVPRNRSKAAQKTTSTNKLLTKPDPAKAARKGSKTEKVLALLSRPGGATAKELMKVTGWQAHSVRGFLSGTLGKKMGLGIISNKPEDGERNYRIKG